MDDRPFIIEKCTGKKRYDVDWFYCSHCTQKFLRRTRNATAVKTIFCSTECRINYESYKHVETSCDTCGTKFDRLESRLRKLNFCDKVCQGKHRGKLHKEARERRLGVKSCPTCETTFSSSRQACSKKCLLEHKYTTFINRWLSGEEDGCVGKAHGINDYIRRYLHEKHKSCCVECGWSKVNPQTGLIPLQIHHIDGKHKNNNIDNLQLLCGACHSITPNYGSLNIGNGREDRRRKTGVAA